MDFSQFRKTVLLQSDLELIVNGQIRKLVARENFCLRLFFLFLRFLCLFALTFFICIYSVICLGFLFGTLFSILFASEPFLRFYFFDRVSILLQHYFNFLYFICRFCYDWLCLRCGRSISLFVFVDILVALLELRITVFTMFLFETF